MSDLIDVVALVQRGEERRRLMDAIREEFEDEMALIDEEIRRRWGQLEGKALVDRGFDTEEQLEALNARLADPHTRAQTPSGG